MAARNPEGACVSNELHSAGSAVPQPPTASGSASPDAAAAFFNSLPESGIDVGPAYNFDDVVAAHVAAGAKITPYRKGGGCYVEGGRQPAEGRGQRADFGQCAAGSGERANRDGATAITQIIPGPSSPLPAPHGRSPARPPLTLSAIVGEWKKSDRRASTGVVYLGRLAYLWARKAPCRSAAIAELRSKLRAEGFRGETVRVSRYIACYWAARLLSNDASVGQTHPDGNYLPAERVGATILRTLTKLLKRDPKTEMWSLRPQCADAAPVFWQRILVEGLSAAAVAAEVDRLRPPRIAPPSRRRSPKARILKLAAKLSLADLTELAAAFQQRVSRLRPSAA